MKRVDRGSTKFFASNLHTAEAIVLETWMIGAEGTVIRDRRVKTGTSAVEVIKVRSKPQTFEWQYGLTGNIEYHAGSFFAWRWQRASFGLARASWDEPISLGSTTWTGGSDEKGSALDDVLKITRRLGGQSTRRLIAYCCEGRTVREMARTYSVAEDTMATVLKRDLLGLARVMNFAN